MKPYHFQHIREFYAALDERLLSWGVGGAWAFWGRVAYGKLSKDGMFGFTNDLIERYALSNQTTPTPSQHLGEKSASSSGSD